MIDISACNVVYLKCRSLLSAWSYQKAPWSKADATTFDTEQEVILMKIERINENQIRCTLTSFDLSARNINLVELAYGTEKARKLFREMIQKASNEVGFEAEDIPLMVEAIPLSSESIMLVITKIEDPEELDTRFSKFSPTNISLEDATPISGEDSDDNPSGYRGAADILDLFKKISEELIVKEISSGESIGRKTEIWRRHFLDRDDENFPVPQPGRHMPVCRCDSFKISQLEYPVQRSENRQLLSGTHKRKGIAPSF